MKCLTFAVVIWCLVHFQYSFGDNSPSEKLTEKFAWKILEFDWPANDVAAKKAERHYVPENNVPYSIDVWGNTMYIAVPRLKSGVVASLNHVDLNEEKSPKLKPYPDWDVSFIKIDSKKTLSNAAGQTPLAPMPPADAAPNNATTTTTSTTTTTTPPPPPDSVPELIDIHDFRTIVSAFQIHVDQHSRLWVLDTGSADILEDPKQIAAPAVVIIHLNSTAYNRREKIHPSVIKYDSFFTNMVVDVGNSPEDAHAYILDTGSYGLVIYSFKKQRFWRVTHQFFHFDPMGGNMNIGSVNMVLNYGIFGMALGKLNEHNSRSVYFHPLSSDKEFSVPSYVLQNEARAKGPRAYYEYSYLGSRGSHGPSGVEVFDDHTNVLFYAKITKNAIGCWLSNTTYTQNNHGSVNVLGFPSDVKIQSGTDKMWILTNQLHEFISNKTLDSVRFNFRVQFGKTSTIVKGTPCEPKPLPPPKKR